MEKKATTRVPKCGYCQNHGIKSPLKAHKRDCKFLDCSCKPCVTTRLRREHMADMQYIKRNGIVELERIKNEQDAQAKKKDIYVKIYQERMANKNKKRTMKDLKSGTPEALLMGDTTGSSSALSPNSSIADPISSQLATLANLRAFTGCNQLVNNLTTPGLESPNLDPQTLANLNATPVPSVNRPYSGLSFSNTNSVAASGENSMITSDQFLKAAKLLGFGLNNTPSLTQKSAALGHSLVDRTSFRNDDVNFTEITEFLDRLSIVDNLNNDEKVLNAAICMLFNSLPFSLINPGNVAEEIYSTFKQLGSTNVFR